METHGNVNERVFAQVYPVTIENTTTNGCDNSYNGDKKKKASKVEGTSQA